jgi:hypothetical protein
VASGWLNPPEESDPMLDAYPRHRLLTREELQQWGEKADA